MRPFPKLVPAVRRLFVAVAWLAVLFGALPSPAQAGGRDGFVPVVPTGETTDRYIVRLKDPAVDIVGRLPAIGSALGGSVTYVRAMSGNAHVVRFSSTLPLAQARIKARQAMQSADIAYMEPDRRMYPLAVPNDPMYSAQWNLYESAGGINAPAAWDVTTGSSSITIGVIDTGYRPHADLAAKIVGGYDFIGDTSVSNDGDGRDADASDPGDYGCPNGSSTSSWHGTHVSGIATAVTNNGVGIAGVSWGSTLVEARVLGRCGGYTSDIADGMRWAAGIAVSGVPVNATPARVLNLSLGGTGACDNTFQSAIDDVVARGTVVVVAAGNSNADVSGFSPASCNSVIAVAATTRTGARASFSNYGTGVAIAAPGVGILSTLNAGSTTPGADNYVQYSGTSMSTPHVAGVVALMLSRNASLTPAQVKATLQSTARAFPTGTGADCTTSLCGAGIVNAAAAVAAVPTTSTRVNIAAASNGAVASASSTYSSGFPVSAINDGDRIGAAWENGGGWNDATFNGYPDWVEIDFPATKSVSEVDVFTIQDNYKNPVTPTTSMTFSQYGITAFDVQYWNGSAWVTVPGGSITGNNRVWTTVAFPTVSTSKIRVQVNASLANYSRIIEVEAYSDAPAVNAARPANGGSAVASSTYDARFPASGAIDGDRAGVNWESGGGWNDATINVFPDTLQVNFNGTRSINEIDVFTVQDNYKSPSEPTLAMTFSQYGITDFDVQYWNGSTWVTVPGGSVSGNNKVWNRFTFGAVSTNAVRVNVRGALAGYSRITEIEAYVAQ